MKKSDAINILKLNPEEYNDGAILTAFNRMTNRYPQVHFPEKYQNFVLAKQILLQGADLTSFRRYFCDDTIDLSWLNKFAKKQDQQSTLPTENKELAIWFKPFMQQGTDALLGIGIDDDGDDFDFDLDMNEMLDMFKAMAGKGKKKR